jgi:hypothetical protein
MAVAQKMFIRKGAIRPQTYRTIPTVMLTWHHKHHRSNDSEVRTIILKRAFSSKTFSLVLFICQVQRCASMPMYFLALFLFIVLRLYWFSLVFYARFQRERMQQKKGGCKWKSTESNYNISGIVIVIFHCESLNMDSILIFLFLFLSLDGITFTGRCSPKQIGFWAFSKKQPFWIISLQEL